MGEGPWKHTGDRDWAQAVLNEVWKRGEVPQARLAEMVGGNRGQVSGVSHVMDNWGAYERQEQGIKRIKGRPSLLCRRVATLDAARAIRRLRLMVPVGQFRLLEPGEFYTAPERKRRKSDAQFPPEDVLALLDAAVENFRRTFGAAYSAWSLADQNDPWFEDPFEDRHLGLDTRTGYFPDAFQNYPGLSRPRAVVQIALAVSEQAWDVCIGRSDEAAVKDAVWHIVRSPWVADGVADGPTFGHYPRYPQKYKAAFAMFFADLAKKSGNDVAARQADRGLAAMFREMWDTEEDVKKSLRQVGQTFKGMAAKDKQKIWRPCDVVI